VGTGSKELQSISQNGRTLSSPPFGLTAAGKSSATANIMYGILEYEEGCRVTVIYMLFFDFLNKYLNDIYSL